MSVTTLHPLSGRKQSPEHIARRVAAVAAARAMWTDEQKASYARTVAEANKGRREEVRRKFAKCNIGRTPWNKGRILPHLSGANHGMFGKTHTPEARAKISAGKRGKRQSPELIAKRVAAREGYTHPDHTKAKIRETNLKTWARPEVRAKTSGPNSPSWLGGKSFEPYPAAWTRELKDRIRQRDHYCCRGCGKPEDENGERLCIHHVDYDKSNVVETNLVAVCKSCHGKTNTNRDEWRAFFCRTNTQVA